MSRVTNKEELLGFFREMTLMRRMEIAADVAYKQRKIRGFLHLYNGQEAVASGLESQMSVDDHAITAYRCHAFLISRRTGVPVKEVLAELQGKSTGASKGKGGSMHMYARRFYGGMSILSVFCDLVFLLPRKRHRWRPGTSEILLFNFTLALFFHRLSFLAVSLASHSPPRFLWAQALLLRRRKF